MSVIIKITLAILVSGVSCEAAKCDGKTCAQCIGESVDCAWCPAADHIGPRCQSNNTINPSWCSEKVDNPIPNKPKEILRNDRITPDPTKVVQLAPQELKISIRPGQTEKFTINYKPAKDYPLDVYYLMDASYTMRNTIQLLRKQGEQIYKRLNQFTNNVRLGAGTFIEKPALPFADPNIHYAYAFKHHLNLTTQRDRFEKVLNNVRTGANYEAPEAGLDALMQVMACKDEIGWRKNSRKIIVLCTDATYHSAGDGKIVGAAKLNDMECHLNKDGAYTLELEQDYPTVNQIRKIAKRENIIVIFNVKNRVIPEYKALADRLDIGAEVIELKENSNITKTIADVYTRKLGNVKMDVSRPDNVLVTLTPDCTVQDTCQVAHASDTQIQVTVTADSCLKREENNTITIKPDGLAETVKITIKTLCECDCEKKPKPNAIKCHSSGSLVCGICECNPNRFGDTCDCIGSSTMHLDKCKAHPEDTVLCSGIDRGSCSCGKCTCNQFYSGDFCEYDERACLKGAPTKGSDLRLICSGKGKCIKEKCECSKDYEGDACQCPLKDDDCRAPYSEKVCSGNGICQCGECNCTRLDSKGNLYHGAFCENCHDCDGNRCKELEKYVLCVYTNETTKEACDEKFQSKNTYVFFVNKTEINTPKYHLAKRCTILRDDGKSIIFKHRYYRKDANMHIIIQKELEEPDRANMWIAIGSAIGAIILIGLLTAVIWKVAVDMYDAREYKRFNKLLDESGDAANINQIYKEPTANFTNPMFNRLSRVLR
ncbi:integrin beta pat-3-like [Cydia amplana]|uniref:integrin beta pat-3-like n=1 Tax=Cydia amplana TaxID=1869771 RepID=UPI002FE5967F